MNICAQCREQFHDWPTYQEHISLAHTTINIERSDDRYGLRVYSSGRTDLGRVTYPGPMRFTDKIRIVARGERRLGLQHFIGD
jgi:hypothetical protein